MSNLADGTTHRSKPVAVGPFLAYAMAGVLAANCASMMGMLESLKWDVRIPVICATGALGGGILLTILTMYELGKRD